MCAQHSVRTPVRTLCTGTSSRAACSRLHVHVHVPTRRHAHGFLSKSTSNAEGVYKRSPLQLLQHLLMLSNVCSCSVHTQLTATEEGLGWGEMFGQLTSSRGQLRFGLGSEAVGIVGDPTPRVGAHLLHPQLCPPAELVRRKRRVGVHDRDVPRSARRELIL